MSRQFNEWNLIKYFTSTEFDSPDVRGSGVGMDMGFVGKLDKLRDMVGEPLTILSGYRTEAHNASLPNSVDGSAHERGLAADIAALSSGLRLKILRGAFALGFRRIGLGDSFIHLDIDTTKPQDVCWTYPPTAKRG